MPIMQADEADSPGMKKLVLGPNKSVLGGIEQFRQGIYPPTPPHEQGSIVAKKRPKRPSYRLTKDIKPQELKEFNLPELSKPG